MTDKELVKIFKRLYCGFCYVQVCSECPYKNHFMKGYRCAEKDLLPVWHDLRKNPKDLPKDEKDVQVLYQDCNKVNPYTCLYDIHGECWLYYNLDNMLLERFDYHVIAWKEIHYPQESER